MAPIIYLMASWFPNTKQKYQFLDHGFLYGDGVFEGIRAYDGLIFS